MPANIDSSGGVAAGGTTTTGTTTSTPSANQYIRVFLHDGASAKEGFYITASSADLSNADLSQIRGLVARSPEQQEFTPFSSSAMLSFCSPNGATVPDSIVFAEYQEKILKAANGATASVIDVYLRKSADAPAAPSGNPSTYAPDPVALAHLKAKFDDNAFKVITGTASKYTAELEEQDWSIISENNALCYGTKLARKTMTTKKANAVETKTLLTGVERAKLPAFRLKQRPILSDKLVSTSVRDLRMYLRMPDYLVDDQSYVTMYETSNNFQASLATSSFSETDVSASVSGSAFGFSAEASASYKASTDSTATAATTKASKQIILAYNFPRVTVLLDEDSIELTRDCERELQKVVNLATLKTFLDKYGMCLFPGEFYSSRVQLGGRLFTSEEVTDSSEAATQALKKTMKVAASASFSGFGYGGSVSASQAETSGLNAANASASSRHSQTWQANGGDTLLCNDPPAWAASVAYHWNWRVTLDQAADWTYTQREDVCHIIDMIGRLPAWGHLPARVAAWTLSSIPPTPIIPQQFFLHQHGTADGRYLVVCGHRTKNLGDAARLFNQTQNSQQGVPMPGKYQTTGAVMLGPKAKVRQPDDLALQLETVEGANVDNPCYNTEYRLRSSKSKLYVSFDVHKRGGMKDRFFHRNEWKFLCASDTKGATAVFRDFSRPSDKATRTAIPDDAAVCMYLKGKEGSSFSEWVDNHSSADGEYVCLELCRERSHGMVKFVFKKKATA
ncbi:hypothetical protein PG997_008967 [Apiospora hydei]|uniref:MACPF domain-containing protein n=1 Tax=Apiospora hydei TaxID=1337664 RepID=A0ABR1WCB2_9PEZI